MTSNDDVLFKEMVSLLHQVFSRNHYATFLSQKEKEAMSEMESLTDSTLNSSCMGYPTSPLLSQLASSFLQIIRTGTCSAAHLPAFPPFDEGAQNAQRVTSILWVREQLQGAISLWDYFTEEQKMLKLANIISRLRRRGLLDLLHVRRTTGSINCLPIPRHRLLKAATELHHPKALLTRCARARDKHIMRDSTGRWGKSGGSEQEKNAAALKIVNDLLDNSVWINIHELPHSIPTLEIREPNGYGLRFDYEPLKFRGFLEPQQEQGWLTRYKH